MRLSAFALSACPWLAAVVCISSCDNESEPESSIQEVLYFAEGNRLRRMDLHSVDEPPLMEEVLIDRADSGPRGRDVNGINCHVPGGNGTFVMGEDSGQPNPPAGWGVFDRDGNQIGKLTATYYTEKPEPFGCAVDEDGRLLTTEVGDQFGDLNGQLIMWFPPFDHFPGSDYPNDEISTNFCKLATDLGTAASIVIDDEGRVYVASARLGVLRFSPPFPTGSDAAGGCGASDALGSPMADNVQREEFIVDPDNIFSATGLARSPSGNWYVSSVFDGVIAEYDADGNFVRRLFEPASVGDGLPLPTGHPQALVVDSNGTLYYSDLQLAGDFPNVGPGPNGKIRRVRFGADGAPAPPEIVREGLSFPDGVAIVHADDNPVETQAPGEWRTYAGGPHRLFFNPQERVITANNVADLEVLWTVETDAIITASPSVARLQVPGEGLIPIVFVQAWDDTLYALRSQDGSELWTFEASPQPGATFPNAGSVEIRRIEGEERLFYAAGETVYRLNAVTGEEIWHFDAGTGCVEEGACGFGAERNEVESSPIVADGKVFFGMDINDIGSGKGGFYAVDADDGRLEWFFDLETGSICRPSSDENIRRYDGYHTEEELGLPGGFLDDHPDCNVDRTGNGCGNVWSSAAVDEERGLLFFTSSNCDTDDDPNTPEGPPPMPPYDEAIVALNFDGSPEWRWRPREVDNDDLAFGAVPNLFQIEVEDKTLGVVGVGNKDGTYYVLDRDGVNEINGVRWDDEGAVELPYWATNVVAGGGIGGIIATAAVDVDAKRIYFSTGPGFDPIMPQLPTVHALDLNTGSIVWQNSTEENADASFGPTSAIPGVVFVGSVLQGIIRAYDSATGERLSSVMVGSAVASGAAVTEGVVLVGAGVGARSNDAEDFSNITSRQPQNITALCVPGTPYCTAARE